MLNTTILAGTAVIAFFSVFGYIIGKMSAHAHKIDPETKNEPHGCCTCKYAEVDGFDPPCCECDEDNSRWEAVKDE